MKTKKILLLSILVSSLLLAALIGGGLVLSETGLLTSAAPENGSAEISPPPEEENAGTESGALPSDPGESAGQASSEESLPEVTPKPAFEEYDIRLMAVGDNLMHMGIVNTGRMADGSYDYSFLFRGIRDFLDTADIKAINQETIFGGNSLGFSGFPRFNSPEEVGDAIAAAGFNVVLHATNHAADQKLEGIYNCVSFWETNYPDILMTGISGEEAGDEIPLLQIRDVTFAILNYTYGPNASTLSRSLRGHLNMLCSYDEKSGQIDFTALNPRVTEDIQKARELADIVVVFPHWGTEYKSSPSSYQRAFARQMTEAGADLIIGTHPHVPQPVEWVTSENGNVSLCYYSLGNYVSTQKQALCMLEGMAWVTFHVTEDGVSLSREGTGVLPLVCHYRTGPNRLENVYLLEEYTQELASSHGIRGYGGVNLKLEELQNWSGDIFGDMVLKRSDIIEMSDPQE